MSSKFSTGSVRLIPPSWCKKGMFVGILPTINGRPLSMNAYVSALVLGSGGRLDLETTLHLSRNGSAGRWEGSVTDGQTQTTVTVTDTANPEVFQMRVSVEEISVPIAVGSWTHNQAVEDDRWDTGLLEAINVPGVNEVRLRVLA